MSVNDDVVVAMGCIAARGDNYRPVALSSTLSKVLEHADSRSGA